jgi:hypothetical protein
MATSFTIPLVTLPVGSQVFGPAHPANGEISLTLTIDRTVAGGLNSLTAASLLTVTVEQSNDGGATWLSLGAWGTDGGLYPMNRAGDPSVVSAGTWPLFAGTSRQLRATVTVAGTSIAVAGSIATQ